METTEKIVESYVRFVKGWATIPNIRCAGQHEIDIFAVDPKTDKRYHIEVSVSGSAGFSKLTDKPFDPVAYKIPTKKATQRRTVGFFIEKKFSPPNIKEKLKEYGCVNGLAHPVIVTWDWTEDGKKAADKAGVELWSFQNIMHEIADAIRHQKSYFSDDTLRTINLFVRALKAKDDKEVAPVNAVKRTIKSESSTTASYWVYRNYIHKRARLHKAECVYCNDGRGTQNAENSSTGKWQKFEEHDQAAKFLSSLKYDNAAPCGICM